MNIIVASDHAGFELKGRIREYLTAQAVQVTDLGPKTADSCDYSHYALELARSVAKGEYDQGILICGTGLGMSMAANRVAGVRAALCINEFMARMSRAHNNSNILCLGGRVVGVDLALSILNAWMTTEFEGGRHKRRVDIFDHVH